MTATDLVIAAVWEDQQLWLAGRVQNNSAANITQASLSSISASAFQLNAAKTVTYGPTALTISSVVFDALQTSDARWTEDATGYNFACTIPGTAFPEGAQRYQVEITFNPVSGGAFYLGAEVTTRHRFAG